MPRIPVYEQTQEQVTNLPSPSINPVMPNAGEAISSAVSGVMNAINRAREEADQFRAQDAINKLNLADNELLFGNGTSSDAPASNMQGVASQVNNALQGGQREMGALNYKGEAALNRGEGNKPLSEEYSAKYQARISEIAGTLGNDNQRRQFLLNAERMRAGFDERVRNHEMQQGDVYKESVYKGSVAVENQRAARYYDNPTELQSAMGRIVEETTRYAMSKGMSKDATKALVLEAQSNMHSIVINRLLEEQKPLAAKAYFDLHRDAIDAKDTSAAIKAVGVVGIDAEVSDFVDKLVNGDFGPGGDDRKPFQIDKMANEIRSKYKNNPQARDVAIKQLVERKQLHDAGVAERLQNDNGQTVNVAVSLVQNANKPTSDDGIYDLEKAIKSLREDLTLKDKPDLLAKAEARLTQDYNVWLAASTKRNEERVGKLWGLVADGVTLEAIQKSDPYKQLGPVQRKKFEDDLRRDEDQRAAARDARESRDWAREQRSNSKNEDAVWTAAGRGETLDAITKKPEWANLPGSIQERLRQQISSARNTEELRKLQEKQRTENTNRDAVWNAVLAKQPMAKIRGMPEWKALGGTDRAQLENQIENFRKPEGMSAGSREEMRINQDANYQMLTEDPDRLARMSEDEIRALVPDLGRGNVSKAITYKRKLQTDAATVKFDKDLLDSRAFKAGIAVYDADGKTDKGKRIKATMAQLNDRVEEVILAKQKNLGRPLREDEKTQVIDTLLMVGPVRMQQKGGLFGSGSISYEDKRVFEVRDMSNFGRPGDREKVINAYTAKGVQPTEEQILRGIAALNKK